MKIELNILARVDNNPAALVSTLIMETQSDEPLNEFQIDWALSQIKKELLEKIIELSSS